MFKMMRKHSEISNADYEWKVSLNRHTLKLLGVWPEERECWISSDIHVLSLVILIFCGLLLPQIYALTMVLNELSLAIDNMFSNIAMCTATTKLCLLWLNRKRLNTVLESIKYDCHNWKYEWERDIMLALAKRGRFFTICGYVMMISSLVGLMCGPMFGISFRIVNNITDFGDRYLPSQTYYPYDVTKTHYYYISYFLQTLSGSFAGVCITSPATFFGTVVFHNCGQLTILGLKIQKLIGSNSLRTISHDKNLKFRHQLKEIVDSHSRIIQVVAKIESSYKDLILAQIIGLTMMMCCLGFQITIALDGSEDSPPVMQLLVLSVMIGTVLIHSFIYCLAGETLIFHCEDMHRKIYESNWYMCSPKYVMALMLISIRTKEPIHLTAGKFVELNLQSFSNILKSSVGYISMLIAVKDK